MDSTTIHYLQDSLNTYYPCHISRIESIPLPTSAYYPERNRYRADSLLNYLKRTKDSTCDLTIALTSKDISITKGNIPDYGIMGLGFTPGTVCVISDFRLSKNTTSEKQVRERFLKVVLHELGHNFGLQHCIYSDSCYMQDAEGSISAIDKSAKHLCENCRKHINLNIP